MTYILLPDHTVRAEMDLVKWAAWFEDSDNRLLWNTRDGRYRVSTAFLGIDHNFGRGTPLLFETMVFKIENGKVNYLDIDCERYSTYEEARVGHKKMEKKYR